MGALQKRLGGFRTAWAVAAVLACACEGSPFETDESCTLIGCVDMLTITVLYENNALFEEGAYRFEMTPIEGPSVQVSCTRTAGGFACEQGPDVTAEMNDAGTGIFIKILGDWWLRGLIVRVERDNVVLGQNTFYPDYQIVTPNGPDCEPTCFQAAIPMELEPPLQ